MDRGRCCFQTGWVLFEDRLLSSRVIPCQLENEWHIELDIGWVISFKRFCFLNWKLDYPKPRQFFFFFFMFIRKGMAKRESRSPVSLAKLPTHFIYTPHTQPISLYSMKLILLIFLPSSLAFAMWKRSTNNCNADKDPFDKYEVVLEYKTEKRERRWLKL